MNLPPYSLELPEPQLNALHALATMSVPEAELRRKIHELLREAQEREGMLEQLRESEARLRQLAENIQEVFWITDPAKNEMIYVSPAYEAIWGRSCASLYESPRTWLEAIHPEDRDRVLDAAMHRQLSGSYDEEYRIVRPDGAVRWIRDRAFSVPNAQGAAYRVAGVAQDVTLRKRSEVQLREQASLLDKAQDAITVRDLEHRIIYWNKSAERLYGWSAEEVMGRPVNELLYKDRTAFYKACERVIRAGEWTGELHQISRDGKELIVEGRWTLVRRPDGQPDRILAINTDITRQKKLEEQFLRAQRMESIGALAGGIAHDLNNVLTPITLAVDLLQLKITDPKCRQILDTISSSARRGAEMVGHVVSFARGVEGRRIDVQPAHLIVDLEKICRETFPRNLQIETRADHGLWPVSGDPVQLHQLLLNLCMNARDAMPRGGALTIRARNVTLDAQVAALNLEATAGPYVVLEVEDTGIGMAKPMLEKIFDPLFTTKETGRGTGLGLSTALSVVRSHGGFMQVESEAGRGTRFSVHLPALTVRVEEPAGNEGTSAPRGQGELVLVVDDETFVQEMTRQILEGFGYRVLLAADGSEAVTLYAQHRHEIALVLTDMMMPIMDGAATTMVLRRMNPDVRVIAVSGITTERNVSKADHAGVKRFIAKPYSADQLLNAIHQVLHERVTF